MTDEDYSSVSTIFAKYRHFMTSKRFAKKIGAEPLITCCINNKKIRGFRAYLNKSATETSIRRYINLLCSVCFRAYLNKSATETH